MCSQLPLANRQADRRSAQAGSFGGLLHGEKGFVRRCALHDSTDGLLQRLTNRIFDDRLDDRGPELLSRFEPVARAQLKQMVSNRISQFFAVDSEKFAVISWLSLALSY